MLAAEAASHLKTGTTVVACDETMNVIHQMTKNNDYGADKIDPRSSVKCHQPHPTDSGACATYQPPCPGSTDKLELASLVIHYPTCPDIVESKTIKTDPGLSQKLNPKDSVGNAIRGSATIDPKDWQDIVGIVTLKTDRGLSHKKLNPKDSVGNAIRGSATTDPKDSQKTNDHCSGQSTVPSDDIVLTVQPQTGNSRFTVNLSSRLLSASETALLDRGLTFVPVYSHMPVHDIYSLQNRLVRNIKLKDYYKDENDEG